MLPSSRAHAVLGLLLLGVLCTGCTGWLAEGLEQRHIASCIWWRGPLGGGYGVTATGGIPLATCLAVPCPCALGR